MDLTIHSYDRQVYTFFELLAHVGGFVSAVFAGTKATTILFLNQDLEWYLISKLYTKKQLRTD